MIKDMLHKTQTLKTLCEKVDMVCALFNQKSAFINQNLNFINFTFRLLPLKSHFDTLYLYVGVGISYFVVYHMSNYLIY